MLQKKKRRNTVILLLLIALAFQQVSITDAVFGASKKVKSVKFTNIGPYCTLTVGRTVQIKTKIGPKKAKKKKLKWKSSKPSVVSVTQKGKIKVKKRGTATITATARDGSKKKDKVVIHVGNRVSSVKYSGINAGYVMKKGQKKRLKVIIAPSNAKNKRISWKSSKPSVASVSSKGTVKAKKKGTAYITARARDGSGRTVKYKMVVGTRVSSVRVSGQSYVGRGSAITLKSTVSPGSASNKKVTWRSSNTRVATVSSAGRVTGRALGAVNITATAKDGTGKAKAYRVTVVMPTKGQTAFVAHRGYSSVTPENTKVAFDKANQYGFDAIECDIWEVKPEPQTKQDVAEQKAEIKADNTPAQNNSVPLTEDKTEKDSVTPEILAEDIDPLVGEPDQAAQEVDPALMVMHDENLSRMCGVNKLITGLTPTQLAAYPVKKGNNINAYGSQKIPSYEEYLDVFEGNSKIPVIEIKSKTPRTATTAISQAAADRVLELLVERGFDDRQVVIQSFNITSVLRIIDAKKRYPELKNIVTLYLTSANSEVDAADMKNYKAKGLSGVCMKSTIGTSAVIDRAQSYGLKVGIYTVDDTTLAYKLSRLDKVNYVISNKKVF